MTKYEEALEFLENRGWVQFMSAHFEEGVSPRSGVLRYGLLAPDRNTRERAVDILNRNGIGANAFYGNALPHINGLEDIFPCASQKYPIATSFAERLLTLPSHEDVGCADICLVASVLSEVASELDQTGAEGR